MKRVHVNLRVRDLEQSVAFYRRLLGAAPTVLEPDYAKWMLDDPRVNFAIGLGAGAPGLEHLGIQAETPEELDELRGRLAGSPAAVEHEGETVCCYARSDKSWVTDAQDVTWELFYTHGSAEAYHAGQEDAAAVKRGERCCGPASRLEGPVEAPASPGCC
jgi:catechol 2,3-dioxygenase-like lactoylglutathione lyase family enzyme